MIPGNGTYRMDRFQGGWRKPCLGVPLTELDAVGHARFFEQPQHAL
jgi:hypothetical protein